MINSKCPYCGSKVELKDSSIIYHGQSFGWVYICSNYPQCNAYVGCHKGTKKSLGRLANEELRKLKNEAHYYFDFIWEKRLAKTKDKKSRKKAYQWLSKQLNIPIKDTHIGMFNEEQCKNVIKICKPYCK